MELFQKKLQELSERLDRIEAQTADPDELAFGIRKTGDTSNQLCLYSAHAQQLGAKGDGMITWHPLAPFHLPDEDVERIAKRVVELMAERKAKPACDHQWLADNGRVGNYHCALCGVPGYRNFTGSVVERR